MHILDKVDAAQLRDDIPEFRAGDTLDVHVKVIEGSKSRLQVFRGVVTVSYTHLTLPTILRSCRSRWSPYH